mmetsp:Transcript_70/g.238  ORF Transcript_70/g.238 Transcript_70/m.238 type:complete len:536 (+) Transcript_70:204-1811(+)|eukprot:CAMPEP_0171493264 /NCGR_PEP_ID=MMETSP0958-20121227/4868_1 /TAXON_ID=87120 /ORGANISM="Aurantiochytrium limacinum, Strain ATCCMYA-1381" /LENGTH=535 /DNA_ID=CAMNT_0012026873 /DNA_START=515 /DNA_END=2122 /DNA_ORIENTATION=+
MTKGKNGNNLVTVAGVAAAALLWKKYGEHQEKVLMQERCKIQGVKVAILGGGMSAICLAIKLQEAGIPFEIFEKSDGFGGTWRHNKYPDCACDVPSHVYSFSFEPRNNWSRKWAKRDEILNYFEEVAAKHRLGEHAHFNCSILSANFNNSSKRWNIKVQYADGSIRESEFTFFVPAAGQLDIPKWPNVPGIEDFRGESWHTAQWRNDIDLKGKKVIGVGTGATAIQAFPMVAMEADHLSVIQRSPIWCFAKQDYEYSELAKNIFRYVPFARVAYRASLFLSSEVLFYGLSTPYRGPGTVYDFVKSETSHEMLEASKYKYPKEVIIPRYEIGCKRIALAEHWLPMLTRDNVDLVTEKTLARITEDGVEYNDGSKEQADVIIYATGFETTQFLSHIEIRNGDGMSLQDYWKDIPKAYKSVAVAHFPNLFFLYGPGSNLGHNSIIFMVETQVNYVMRMIKFMIDRGATSIEVNEEDFEQDFQKLQKDLQETTFADPSCTSWYKRPDGTIVNNWGSSCLRFWYHLSGLDKDAYTLGSRL